jgi:hypothetical protein
MRTCKFQHAGLCFSQCKWHRHCGSKKHKQGHHKYATLRYKVICTCKITHKLQGNSKSSVSHFTKVPIKGCWWYDYSLFIVVDIVFYFSFFRDSLLYINQYKLFTLNFSTFLYQSNRQAQVKRRIRWDRSGRRGWNRS